MSWNEIQLWMLAALVVFTILGFIHKRKARQGLRERHESEASAPGENAETESGLDRIAKWVFGWQGYVLIAVVLVVTYAFDAKRLDLVLALAVVALLVATVALNRARRKQEETPRNPFDG